MRRADVELGIAATDLAMGGLSSVERRLASAGEAPSPLAREHHEEWAYFHLTVACNAAAAMDRMTWDGEYAAKYREREHALAMARDHLDQLRALGPLDATLATLAERAFKP